MGIQNKAMLTGRVGADPEKRSLRDGESVVNFRMATSESWKDKQTGERKQVSEWHNIVVYAKHAVSFIDTYVRKGDLVQVEGSIKYREYEKKEGGKGFVTEIVVRPGDGDVKKLNYTDKDAGNSDRSSSSIKASPNYSQELDDDIPF